jgi:hypothetical protein
MIEPSSFAIHVTYTCPLGVRALLLWIEPG